jgi:hypothetical protein
MASLPNPLMPLGKSINFDGKTICENVNTAMVGSSLSPTAKNRS